MAKRTETDERREHMIGVKVTEEEYERLRRLAFEARTSVASFVRDAALSTKQIISLAREGDGERKAGDLLRWCTHGPPREIVDQYTTPSWEALCAEVSCVRLELPPSDPSDGDPDEEDDATNGEEAGAVTASTSSPAVRAAVRNAVTARFYCGADGTRIRIRSRLAQRLPMHERPRKLASSRSQSSTSRPMVVDRQSVASRSPSRHPSTTQTQRFDWP